MDDKDLETMLRTLGQACLTTGLRIHAWVADDKPLPMG